MSRKKVACRPRSSDDLKAAFWEASSFKERCNGEATKWCFLGRFHNQNVAGGESRCCFHNQSRDRGVERVDSGTNSEGFMADKLDEAVVGGIVAAEIC